MGAQRKHNARNKGKRLSMKYVGRTGAMDGRPVTLPMSRMLCVQLACDMFGTFS